MKVTLTLHKDQWFGDEQGPIYARGNITGYRVGGMPDGKWARIANFGAPKRDEWRIMRINADNTQSDWTEPYDSAEDALAVLQQDYQK